MAPFCLRRYREHLKAIQAKLADAEKSHEQILEEVNPPLTLSDAWDSYLNSVERPDTGEATLKYYAGYLNRFQDWVRESYPEVKYLRESPLK
jgi:hypothetical protein